MIAITIRLDPRDLTGELDDFGRRQLPFGTALALNRVAFDFQADQQAGLARRFTLRRATFVQRGIYFPREQRADYRRGGELAATVSIEPKRDFLTKFEQGGWKSPQRKIGRLAVPIDARRGKTGVVAMSERLSSLGLRLHGRGPKGTVSRGIRRTFSIRLPDGRGFVFRRVGRGRRSDLRLLYIFRPRVPIPPSLEFMDTAEAVARARFVPAFIEGFNRALRTAR